MYCSETANNNRCTWRSTRNQINMYSGANQTKSERQGVKFRKVGRWIDKESKSTQSHGTTRSQVPERKGNMKWNTHCFEADRSWRNLSWMRKMEEWKCNSVEGWVREMIDPQLNIITWTSDASIIDNKRSSQPIRPKLIEPHRYTATGETLPIRSCMHA